jgi:hypothetical protein
MKIFFTSSRYDSPFLALNNFKRAVEVFSQYDVQYLSVLGTVIQTFNFLKKLADSNDFVWIDADNYVYDSAVEILKHKAPAILMTINEYGISYGHGGIKYIKSTVNIPEDINIIDVSRHVNYKPIDIIGSFHHLGEGYIKCRTIFAEMAKLALRGSYGKKFLEPWKIARPDIWTAVDHYARNCESLMELKQIVNNRQKFKEYYDTELCGNLQE